MRPGGRKSVSNRLGEVSRSFAILTLKLLSTPSLTYIVGTNYTCSESLKNSHFDKNPNFIYGPISTGSTSTERSQHVDDESGFGSGFSSASARPDPKNLIYAFLQIKN